MIAERHKFWTASQEESESVSEFMVRLKKLASTCSFGAFLSQSLRDRLVSALHPKMSRTQRHLLSIRELTYSMAHDKCIANGMAGKANIGHMGDSTNSDAEVQQVLSTRNVEPNSKRADKCKSCGSMQHGSESCRFKNATCHHCQKKGHIRPICKACLSQLQFKGRSRGKKESKVNSCDSISDDESVGSCDKPRDSSEDVAFGLYRTGTEQLSAEFVNRVKPYVVNVQLGKGQINCKMEVDTGACRSTVSKNVYDAELSDYPIQPVGVILRNYSGEKIPVVGKNYCTSEI